MPEGSNEIYRQTYAPAVFNNSITTHWTKCRGFQFYILYELCQMMKARPFSGQSRWQRVLLAIIYSSRWKKQGFIFVGLDLKKLLLLLLILFVLRVAVKTQKNVNSTNRWIGNNNNWLTIKTRCTERIKLLIIIYMPRSLNRFKNNYIYTVLVFGIDRIM